MGIRGVCLVVLAGALACSAPSPRPGASTPVAGDWHYEVTVGQGARSLDVEATFAPGTPETLVFEGSGARFVRGFERADGRGWTRVYAKPRGFAVPGCFEGGCRVRYRFAMDEAAAQLHDSDGAIAHGAAFQSPLANWLAHPRRATPRKYRIHATVAEGLAFTTGLTPVKRDTWESVGANLDTSPYAAMGPWRIRAAPSGISLAIAPFDFSMTDSEIAAWVDEAARGIGHYYGRFPVENLLVLVTPGEDLGDRTRGGGGASIQMRLPQKALADDARRSAALSHEMVRASSPSLGPPHQWLEDGIANYVSRLARARDGVIAKEAMWHDILRDAPQGLPEADDEGLERTHTWGRTYWGGALFCLLADIEIRERTKNTRSLDDALRAVARAGGTVRSHWELDALLAYGDAAAGVPVLREMARAWGFRPIAVDLGALWKRLGVTLYRDSVVFDDTAPLAAVRRAITAPPR